MYLDTDRANKISGAVLLIGVGLMFYTGYWFAGIIFLIGAESVIQGLARGQGWVALQSGVWFIAFGLWAIFGFSIALLLVGIGISLLISAFIRPPIMKPKPFVDDTLE